MGLQKINWLQINTIPPSGSTIIIGSSGSPINTIYSETFIGSFIGDGSGLTNLPGKYSILNQSAPSTIWYFNHQMGVRFIPIQVYDTDGAMMIPANIICVDDDNATIHFSSNTAGVAVATYGSSTSI